MTPHPPHPIGSAAKPDRLARLMSLEGPTAAAWSTRDLRIMVRHQFEAPLLLDMAASDDTDADLLDQLDEPLENWQTLCLADLLRHERPPVALLELVKRFAKRSLGEDAADEAALPREVAAAIYYLSIATALSRSGRTISHLSRNQLRQGLHWLLAQPWLDEPAGELTREAAAALERSDR
ncbi:MAG: hypothetical protein WD534_06315 [Phycisphaeraceae bacterium]